MGQHANMVKVTAASPGTGSVTVSTAVSGFRTFAQGYNSADATVAGVRIEDASDATIWEIDENCAYTHSGTTLSRGTRKDSSTGSAVNFTGSVVVSVIATAGFGNLLELQLDRATTTITTNNSTQQTISGGAGTYVITNLDTVVVNPYSWWDGSTNKFTPLRAGTYLIFASSQIVDNLQLSCAIYKNGSMVLTGPNFATVAYGVSSVTGLVSANGTTDYFELRAFVGGNCTIYHGNGLFQAIYIGE